ncbi:MAG: DUF4830 domain-containing protein [Clostridiales bacterium]|jgi:hypothetical protein|nr:DUF4830 domain-containing protein [Clostridiales bacterium]
MVISLKKLKKIVTVLLIITSLLLIGMIFISKVQKPAEASGKTYPDNNSRLLYLNQCGWKVDENNFIEENINIPHKFNKTYEKYNEIQRLQGFDLSDYKGVKATQYTYDITNYPNNRKNVKAVLIIYNDRIIGGHIYSADTNGFMMGLKEETLF